MSANLYPNMASAPDFDGAQSKMPPPSYSPQPSNVPMSQINPGTTNTVVVIDNFPPESFHMKCFHCNEEIKTNVKPSATYITWLLCSLLCCLGCFCGCCLIPFCTNGTRDVYHYCPSCKKYLGVRQGARMGRNARQSNV